MKKVKDFLWKLREVLKKIKFSQIFSIHAVTALLVVFISLIIAKFLIFNFEVLNVIIVSASVIVTLITGFLFNEYSNLKKFRIKKLNSFAELQKDLLPYQRAFEEVSRQLRRKNNNLDFLLGKDYMKFRKDIDFWENNENAYGIDFVKALYELGSHSIDVPDFELSQSIINKSLLDRLHEAAIEASGLLARKKHYKHILDDLKLKSGNDFKDIKIVEDIAGFKNLIKIISDGYTGDWRTLDFWEIKIQEAVDILDKMKAYSRFIYEFDSKKLKNFSRYLILSSFFGVIIPILLISLRSFIPSFLKAIFINMSVLGFLVFFILSLFKIHNLISSKELKLT